jgi:hypothetical protein
MFLAAEFVQLIPTENCLRRYFRFHDFSERLASLFRRRSHQVAPGAQLSASIGALRPMP